MELLSSGASGFLGNNVRPFLKKMHDVLCNYSSSAISGGTFLF